MQRDTARYDFHFGVYEYYPYFVVAHPKEGAFLNTSNIRQLIELGKKHYDRPFGFISNRVNHSSGQLIGYDRVIKELPHLSALAIVAYRPLTATMAETERQLVKGIHFKVVDDLEEAKQWVFEVLGVPPEE